MEVQIENKKQCLIISKALVESVMKRCSITDFSTLSTIPGSNLESIEANILILIESLLSYWEIM